MSDPTEDDITEQDARDAEEAREEAAIRKGWL